MLTIVHVVAINHRGIDGTITSLQRELNTTVDPLVTANTVIEVLSALLTQTLALALDLLTPTGAILTIGGVIQTTPIEMEPTRELAAIPDGMNRALSFVTTAE